MNPYIRLTSGNQLYSIVGIKNIIQEDRFEFKSNFKIFDAQSDVQETIAEDINGSPLNHSEWVRQAKDMNSLIMKIVNISSVIHIPIDNYDELLWSTDKLKKVSKINWDKIFKRIFGRTNFTEKIFIMDVNFTQKLNDVFRQFDKRYDKYKKYEM